MARVLLALFILLLSTNSKSAIIEVGFSGTIEENFADVAVDSIFFGSFRYDSDASSQPYGFNEYYSILSAKLNFGTESATINSGFVSVTDNRLSFSAGPALGLSNVFGNTEAFSQELAGVVIRGMGFSINGAFTEDVLPSDSALIYGASGSFFINRSIGTLYDVNTPELLKIPASQSTELPSPNTILIFGLVIIGCTSIRAIQKRQP